MQEGGSPIASPRQLGGTTPTGPLTLSLDDPNCLQRIFRAILRKGEAPEQTMRKSIYLCCLPMFIAMPCFNWAYYGYLIFGRGELPLAALAVLVLSVLFAIAGVACCVYSMATLEAPAWQLEVLLVVSDLLLMSQALTFPSFPVPLFCAVRCVVTVVMATPLLLLHLALTLTALWIHAYNTALVPMSVVDNSTADPRFLHNSTQGNFALITPTAYIGPFGERLALQGGVAFLVCLLSVCLIRAQARMLGSAKHDVGLASKVSDYLSSDDVPAAWAALEAYSRQPHCDEMLLGSLSELVVCHEGQRAKIKAYRKARRGQGRPTPSASAAGGRRKPERVMSQPSLGKAKSPGPSDEPLVRVVAAKTPTDAAPAAFPQFHTSVADEFRTEFFMSPQATDSEASDWLDSMDEEQKAAIQRQIEERAAQQDEEQEGNSAQHPQALYATENEGEPDAGDDAACSEVRVSFSVE